MARAPTRRLPSRRPHSRPWRPCTPATNFSNDWPPPPRTERHRIRDTGRTAMTRPCPISALAPCLLVAVLLAPGSSAQATTPPEELPLPADRVMLLPDNPGQ